MESIIRYSLEIFSVYILTCVIASSSIFDWARTKIKQYTPMLKIKEHKHFIECRLCLGFWVSVGVCTIYSDIKHTLLVYGVSYFLATQER